MTFNEAFFILTLFKRFILMWTMRMQNSMLFGYVKYRSMSIIVLRVVNGQIFEMFNHKFLVVLLIHVVLICK